MTEYRYRWMRVAGPGGTPSKHTTTQQDRRPSRYAVEDYNRRKKKGWELVPAEEYPMPDPGYAGLVLMRVPEAKAAKLDAKIFARTQHELHGRGSPAAHWLRGQTEASPRFVENATQRKTLTPETITTLPEIIPDDMCESVQAYIEDIMAFDMPSDADVLDKINALRARMKRRPYSVTATGALQIE
jgi:hypothetical protein